MAERERIVSWADPAELASLVRQHSGLDVLRGVIDGRYPPPPMGSLMGLRLVEVDRGRAVFEADPSECHYNPAGVVHGGFAATILDSAMGCAVHTLNNAGDAYTTIELKVNLVRAIRVDTGRVRAIGTVLHGGRTIALADARLEDLSGKLYAHATSTCLIIKNDA